MSKTPQVAKIFTAILPKLRMQKPKRRGANQKETEQEYFQNPIGHQNQQPTKMSSLVTFLWKNQKGSSDNIRLRLQKKPGEIDSKNLLIESLRK